MGWGWRSKYTTSSYCSQFFFFCCCFKCCFKCILVLLARRDSGALCCLATALIIEMYPKDADGTANSVDPDDLGLHCLP